MTMQKIMESFNNFVNEEEGLPDFRFDSVLISTASKERGKDDILSDIRSLPGVTVVAVREADKPHPGRDYSLLSLKVDRLTLGHDSVPSIIKKLTHRINKLEGVFSFSVKGIPEPI